MEAVNHQNTSFPQEQDLKLTFHTNSCSLVKPSEPTKRRSMFLSNIDLALNMHVKTVHFFCADSQYPSSTVTEMIILALEKLLVPYDFVAGRLQVNEKTGRLEIDCNAQGVSYVTASCELELEALGELCSNPIALQQLAPMPELSGQLKDQPILAFQVTSFKCGGYSVGFSVNHIAMDGCGYQIFFMNLISIISNGTLAVAPVSDRQLLVPTTSPFLTSSLHSHIKILDNMRRLPMKLNLIPADLKFLHFYLSPGNVLSLKKKASMDGSRLNPEAITTFNVVASHIWKCKALATCGPDKDKTSSFTYAVDIRRRVWPAIPRSYAGNAVLIAYAQSTCQDLRALPFSRVVKMVHEGTSRMSDEYIRAVIEVGLDKGLPIGDVLVTNWMNFEYGDMVFKFGKPKWFFPLPILNSEIITLYSGVEKGSVSAFIGVPNTSMEQFHSLFYSDVIGQQSHL